MGAATELQVLAGVGPVDDNRIGGRSPPPRVAIGGGQADEEHLAGRQLDATHHRGLGGDPAHELVGAVVAEQLRHRVAQQAGLGPQAGQLVGVVQQRQDAVADQAGGRLVAGHVERDQLRHRARRG